MDPCLLDWQANLPSFLLRPLTEDAAQQAVLCTNNQDGPHPHSALLRSSRLHQASS